VLGLQAAKAVEIIGMENVVDLRANKLLREIAIDCNGAQTEWQEVGRVG
jgi:uncharacterized protein (DUF2345 family)